MTSIQSLWPTPGADLTDEQLLELYAPPAGPWLRMNFISSLDGAVTRDGLSGGLGDEADHRVFELLRRWADVVLLGAGTARAEGYGGMRLPEEAERWRVEQGLAAQPVFALVTRRLDLDPASPIFTDAPVTPLIFTASEAPADRRAALSEVAEIVDVGETVVDPAVVRAQLEARGHRRIHSEGGPTLFGAFLEAGVVDELCLTLAPTLEAGSAMRITQAPQSAPTAMELAGVLRGGDELLLRYTKSGGGDPGAGGVTG
ncbi:pyrimidine reductase family protein [Brachybacterium sp. AOP29-B2-41]|uniref:pyrimidine reductase family protein n=1 Tax=Brachybacterium sp. AOP29-B2-41 TaxID=3457704 RepID=UPI0040334370